MGGRERATALLGSSGRGRRADRACGGARLLRHAGANAATRGECRKRCGVPTIRCRLHDVQYREPGPSGNALEHRRDSSRATLDRARPAGRAPARRLSRWRAHHHRLDEPAVHRAERIPRITHLAGRDHGLDRARSVALPGGHYHGPTNERSNAKLAGRPTPVRRGPNQRAAPDPKNILEGLTTALVVLDDDLLVTYFNLAAQDLCGLSARQAVGQPLRKLIRPSDELVALCERALA